MRRLVMSWDMPEIRNLESLPNANILVSVPRHPAVLRRRSRSGTGLAGTGLARDDSHPET
jgi:hypothetical protein